MKKVTLAVAALTLAGCGSDGQTKNKTGNSSDNGSGNVLGSTCSQGDTACDGGLLLSCGSSGKFAQNKDCSTTGRTCDEVAAGVFDCVTPPPAAGTCTTGFKDAGGFAFFDNDIYESYTIINYGDTPGWEYLEVDHSPDASGTYELPDVRDPAAAEASQVPVNVIFASGLGTAAQKLYIAVGGTITLGEHGTEEGSVYSQIDLTNITAVELAEGAEGWGIPEGAEEACLSKATLKDLPVFRYPCFFMDMEVGQKSCLERTDDSVIVNCEEGPLQTSSGNAGQLTLDQNCGAAGCGGTPEAPVCQ